MCLSDTALSVFEKHDSTAAVVEEAKCNFPSTMCMFALASVIGCTIESYYPISNDSAAKENWDSLAKMFNCSIHPRYWYANESAIYPGVHIFRCATMPARFLVDRKVPEVKNHFVALWKPVKDTEPGEQYFVASFPTLTTPTASSLSTADSG